MSWRSSSSCSLSPSYWLVGGSPQGLADSVKSFDPTTIEDPWERGQAEVVQVFSGTVNLSEVLAELGLS